MLVARRLWELSQALQSGALRLQRTDGATAALSVELSRGWVYGVDLSPAWSRVGDAPAQGGDRLRVLLSLTQGSGGEAYVVQHWESPAVPPRRGPVQPFHPATTLRNHVDSQKRELSELSARIGTGRVQLREPVHPSCIAQDERPLLAFLLRPRTLTEIERVALCPPDRAQRLLGFLDTVGALDLMTDGAPSPIKVLELAENASAEEVRQAYQRLAKELHPDRHPQATSEELQALARRFAEVSAAYRRLLEGHVPGS
jgi:hypothetical protein